MSDLHRRPGSSASPAGAAEPLRRELSLGGLIIIAVNGMIGTGIFGLAGAAAAQTGSFSPLLFVFGGLLMAALMASFAQASSWFSGTGGPIVYTRSAFGRFVGFETGWCLYVSRVASLAANGNLLALSLGAFVPGAASGIGRIAVLAMLLAGFAWLNITGLRRQMASLTVITIGKLVPLLVFIAVGASFLSASTFADFAWPAGERLGPSMLLVFYAFIGFEGALVPAGEARNPERDMPRAMLASAVLVTALYVAIQVAYVAAGAPTDSSGNALAEAAGWMMGPFGFVLISVGVILSVLGNFSAAVLAAPRMTYALGLDGSLPGWFAAVHPRHATPHRSIAFYCGLGFLLAALGSFAELAAVSSITRLFGYATTVAALPRLRHRFGGDPAAMRLPGGLLIPAFAFALCVGLLVQAEIARLAGAVGLAGLGLLLYGAARLGASRASR